MSKNKDIFRNAITLRKKGLSEKEVADELGFKSVSQLRVAVGKGRMEIVNEVPDLESLRKAIDEIIGKR